MQFLDAKYVPTMLDDTLDYLSVMVMLNDSPDLRLDLNQNGFQSHDHRDLLLGSRPLLGRSY
jgi:hypothetical protein